MKIINNCQFKCPMLNSHSHFFSIYCPGSFSRKADLIEHFKEVLYEEIELFCDRFDYFEKKAEKAEVYEFYEYEKKNKYLNYRDIIKDELNSNDNDNEKINYDIFDNDFFQEMFYMNQTDYPENERFIKKGKLEILRIQMGISKLYKIYIFENSICNFLDKIESIKTVIDAMYNYMDFNLMYGYYPDENGKLYFWLNGGYRCYKKKEVAVRKKYF